MGDDDFQHQRAQLIRDELPQLGIHDEAVLHAMMSVPREHFVSEKNREFAYRNAPLPIGFGQTISQPLIVAYMIEASQLASHERLLEIGTGSGYAAAVMSKIAKEVLTVERHPKLAESARKRLKRLGYENIRVFQSDGTLGLPEHAPFAAIIVAACGPSVPPPLLQQLELGGRLVIPVGEKQGSQKLVRVTRQAENKFKHEELGFVHFVPLVGEAGW
ncbi:protein-L-isoaspartate(D-aspartate) O-methyltransferase [Novipirellula caenicola]|uniref:Protein-L-isoaspartate O-methyltransferase n=1 Tax=Novipirellula caenicola TaxID=1536901 RepID=A0ABP9W175_9BACT